MNTLSKIVSGIGKVLAPLTFIGLISSCAPKAPEQEPRIVQYEKKYRTATVLDEQVTTEFTYSKIVDQHLKNSGGIGTIEESTQPTGEVSRYHLMVRFDDNNEYRSFWVRNLAPVMYHNYLADLAKDVKPGSKVKFPSGMTWIYSDGHKSFRLIDPFEESFYGHRHIDPSEGKGDRDDYVRSNMISAEDK